MGGKILLRDHENTACETGSDTNYEARNCKKKRLSEGKYLRIEEFKSKKNKQFYERGI